MRLTLGESHFAQEVDQSPDISQKVISIVSAALRGEDLPGSLSDLEKVEIIKQL